MRRTLFLSGAAGVAIAAVVAAGALSSSPSATDSTVSLVGADQSYIYDQMRDVLTPVDKLDIGSKVEHHRIKDAVSSKRLQPPADVVVTPSHCSNLVDLSGLDGWVQIGKSPTGHVDVSLAGVRAGGLDIDKIRADAADCKAATVEVRSLGLTGTFSLTEFETTAVDGMRTIGIQQTVSFDKAASVDSLDAVDAQAVSSMESTSYQVYMTDGEIAAASCSEEPVIAAQNAVAMQEKALAIVA